MQRRCHLVIAPRLYEAPTWPRQATQQNQTKERVVKVLVFGTFSSLVFQLCGISPRGWWTAGYIKTNNLTLWTLNSLTTLANLISSLNQIWSQLICFKARVSVLDLLQGKGKWRSSGLYGFRAGAKHKQSTLMVRLLWKYLHVWNRAPANSGNYKSLKQIRPNKSDQFLNFEKKWPKMQIYKLKKWILGIWLALTPLSYADEKICWQNNSLDPTESSKDGIVFKPTTGSYWRPGAEAKSVQLEMHRRALQANLT